MYKKLSIIIPVFNEESTIEILLQKIADTNLIGEIRKELVIVNDGSTDHSDQKIEFFISKHTNLDFWYIKNKINKGKGNAIKYGLQIATGDLILIQDADLEYNPSDYNAMLEPILSGEANVVYGSRFLNKNLYKKSYWCHRIINKGISSFSNWLSGLHLTDIQTCYKLIDANLLKSIDLCENRFSFDHELTAKLSKNKFVKVNEVAISYEGRSYKEKKIGWIDALAAIYAIIRYNKFSKSGKTGSCISSPVFNLEVNKLSV